MKHSINMLFILFMAFFYAGCGSSAGSNNNTGNPLTPGELISGIKDTDDNEILASGTEIEINSTIKITFSAEMETSSITVEGDEATITLTNESGNRVNITKTEANSDNIDNNEFIISFDTDLMQLSSYTLTIAGGESGIKDSNNNYLNESVTYIFTTSCAIGDNFSNSETIDPSSGCWNYYSVNGFSLEPYITADENEASITFSMDASAKTISGSDFTIHKNAHGDGTYTLTIDSVEMTASNNPMQRIGLKLFPGYETGNNYPIFIYISDYLFEQCIYAYFQTPDDTSDFLPIETTDYPIQVRITVSGNVATTSYKTAGDQGFTDILSIEYEPFDDDYTIGIYYYKLESTPFSATVSNFSAE